MGLLSGKVEEQLQDFLISVTGTTRSHPSPSLWQSRGAIAGFSHFRYRKHNEKYSIHSHPVSTTRGHPSPSLWQSRGAIAEFSHFRYGKHDEKYSIHPFPVSTTRGHPSPSLWQSRGAIGGFFHTLQLRTSPGPTERKQRLVDMIPIQDVHFASPSNRS